MISAEWLSAHHLRRSAKQWLRAISKWATTPLVFVMLFVLPALESHLKLFKKEKLTYAVAPKSAGNTPNVSCVDLEALGRTPNTLQADFTAPEKSGEGQGALALI